MRWSTPFEMVVGSRSELLERMGDDNEAVRQHALAVMQARHRRRQAKDESKGPSGQKGEKHGGWPKRSSKLKLKNKQHVMSCCCTIAAPPFVQQEIERRLHHQLYDALDRPTQRAPTMLQSTEQPEVGRSIALFCGHFGGVLGRP